MKAQLQRTSYDLNFIPYDSLSAEALNKVRAGEVVECSFKKVRNPEFHRKYMKLVRTVFDNQEKYTQFEKFRKAVLMEAGHTEPLGLWDGTIVDIPASINFDKLDEIGFRDVYSDTIDALLRMLPHLGVADLERMSEEVISFDG